MWLLISWWTVNAAPTHHLIVPDISDSRSNTSLWVICSYFSKWLSFFLLSSSSSLILFFRNATPVSILVHAHLLRNRRLAMMVWKICASSSLIFFPFSSPQIGGLNLVLLHVLCSFLECLQVPLAVTPSCQSLSVPLCGFPTAFPIIHVPSLCLW